MSRLERVAIGVLTALMLIWVLYLLILFWPVTLAVSLHDLRRERDYPHARVVRQ